MVFVMSNKRSDTFSDRWQGLGPHKFVIVIIETTFGFCPPLLEEEWELHFEKCSTASTAIPPWMCQILSEKCESGKISRKVNCVRGRTRSPHSCGQCTVHADHRVSTGWSLTAARDGAKEKQKSHADPSFESLKNLSTPWKALSPCLLFPGTWGRFAPPPEILAAQSLKNTIACIVSITGCDYVVPCKLWWSYFWGQWYFT